MDKSKHFNHFPVDSYAMQMHIYIYFSHYGKYVLTWVACSF